MTAKELRVMFNEMYGIDKKWPATFEVSAETYANCCQFVFNYISEEMEWSGHHTEQIHLGRNNGLMFKNVELIYKAK